MNRHKRQTVEAGGPGEAVKVSDGIEAEGQEPAQDATKPERARLSRRGLIAKGAAVAAGGVGLAALAATPAEASTGTMQYGTTNNAGTSATYLSSSASGTLWITNDNSGYGCVLASEDGRSTFYGRVAVKAWGVDGGGAPGVPLELVPHPSTIGQPIAGFHAMGAVFVDILGRHFLCAAPGTPGIWVRPGLNPITPYRVCDTRSGTGTPYSTGVKLGPGQNLLIDVVGGPLPVPTGGTAIVANLTVTGATAASYLTVYPADVPRPTASNINFVGGQTIANQVTVGLDTTGNFRVYNNVGSTHVIIDIVGFFF